MLLAGGVVAYPTEAVFGLGCDPQNDRALQRVLDLKQRPAEKGLIVIASDFDQLRSFLVDLPPDIEKRVLVSWPGPVTWVIPARDSVSPLLRGKHETLAVRVTAHPVAAQLCREFGGAIVSTSANLADRPPLLTAQAVCDEFGGAVDAVIDEPTGGGDGVSQIRDALSGRIIRA